MPSILSSIYVLVGTILSFQGQADARISAHQIATPLSLHVNVVHQFPSPNWIENLAITSWGDILCTVFTSPNLYLVDATTGSATLLYSFDSVLGVLGITQLGHDIFYVAGGNMSLATLVDTPGSWVLFKVDIRGYYAHGVAGIKVTELANIKEALLFNGVTRVNNQTPTILIADSLSGVVWQVNADTGSYTLGIDIPEMKPPTGPGLQLGVNGIKVKDGYLYFSNTALGTLNRVAIDMLTGTVSGPVETMASGIKPDDFVLGRNGLIWIAQNAANTITVLLNNGTLLNVAGSVDSLAVAGPSACEFGSEDRLYCSTTGGLESPVNGTFIGGEIIEIDTNNFNT